MALLFAWVIYEVWPERPMATVISGYDGIKGSVHKTPGLSVQFWDEGKLFATNDRFVFCSRDKGLSWKKVARLSPGRPGPVGWLRDKVARLKLVRSLRRRSGCSCGASLRILQDGTILASSGGIYRGRIDEEKITRLVNVHRGPGMLHQGWAESREGVVYFGEYLCGKHAVTHLYWSQDQGRTWDILHTFPRTEVRHIHAVAYDSHRNLLWLATGDSDYESRILYSSDHGATLQELGSGSQDWRAVSLQFTPKAIYWGTDSPNRQNHIFRWDWNTGHKEILLTVRNPFYYSVQDGKGNLFFSTAVERPAIDGSSMFSELWMIRCDNQPRRLASWPKGELKGYGVIKFAQGVPPQGWVAFTPINLQGHHCEALVAKVPQ